MSKIEEPQVPRVKKRRLLNLSQIYGDNHDEDHLPTEAERSIVKNNVAEPMDQAAKLSDASIDEEAEQTDNEEPEENEEQEEVVRPKGAKKRSKKKSSFAPIKNRRKFWK
jgi:hypothetical protein